MKKILLILFVIAAARFIYLENDHVSHGPGVLAPESPQQREITSPGVFTRDDYTITPLAEFRVKAKVLARENYRFGRESDLSPVDLALGWGRMSDENIVDLIDFSQSNRWYTWRTDVLPIPAKEISAQSANMHLIPANKQVHASIKQTRTGDIVVLSGKLVRVDAEDGWQWSSSLSRIDTGASSCELIWVESFEIQDLQGSSD